MGQKVTIGGERLGSGKKDKVNLHGYDRSSHDLGYVWKNTMASGTLVPFMSKLALPGDGFDVGLNMDIQTHPTVGPLFDTFKVQLDIFQCPVRLYQSALHNNRLDIGNKTSQIKLPKISIEGRRIGILDAETYKQVNPSCILNYVGINSIGYPRRAEPTDPIPYKSSRDFNAVPMLAYLDIFKNYYANKQEEKAYMIHTNPAWDSGTNPVDSFTLVGGGNFINFEGLSGQAYNWSTATTHVMNIIVEGDVSYIPIQNMLTVTGTIAGDSVSVRAKDLFAEWDIQYNPVADHTAVVGTLYTGQYNNGENVTITYTSYSQFEILPETNVPPVLEEFDLSDIDDLRELILKTNWNEEFKITKDDSKIKYFDKLLDSFEDTTWAKEYSQEGLLVKGYQSDLFNNWINTEWIDGENGINEITSVKVNEDGEITMNQISLMKKLWTVLNRIALSGGTYKNWIETVYDENSFWQFETPMFMGGLSQELGFQQVISNTETKEQPLGTLGGRGMLGQNKKGGYTEIKVNEPSYIIGIASLTPRISYSQGNQFDVSLDSLADFHYPGLDQIGFQNLITDQMSGYDTELVVNTGGEPTVRYRSAGKVPAWINYMTSVNKNYGNFALKDNEMFMTLDRRYEYEPISVEVNGNAQQVGLKIKDLTTYIDPEKYNYAFAQTSIDAMNFWVQIDVKLTSRRKMSAQVMPNL